jgi:sugar lactone lactonase YvrE
MQEWSAECVLDAQATLAEGPSWLEETQTLLWVDIEESRICLFDPSSGKNRVLQLPNHVGVAVPSTNGDLVAATFDGFVRVDLASGAMTPIADPEQALPRNRFNDGKCDPRGRLWAGSISYDREPGAANLYRLTGGSGDHDAEVQLMLDGVSTSNGLAWNEDGTAFYYIDTPTRQVDRFDYDAESGAISNRTTVIQVPEELGKPDGMTIDREGMLWVALWGGSAVTRWNPQTGELIGRIPLPAERITSCCFGGADYQQLFITCARTGLTDDQLRQQPLAGGIFRADVGVSGYPCVAFSG